MQDLLLKMLLSFDPPSVIKNDKLVGSHMHASEQRSNRIRDKMLRSHTPLPQVLQLEEKGKNLPVGCSDEGVPLVDGLCDLCRHPKISQFHPAFSSEQDISALQREALKSYQHDSTVWPSQTSELFHT